jgi:hypothetical protein
LWKFLIIYENSILGVVVFPLSQNCSHWNQYHYYKYPRYAKWSKRERPNDVSKRTSPSKKVKLMMGKENSFKFGSIWSSYFCPTAEQVTSGLLQDKLLLSYCRTSYFWPTAGQVTSSLLLDKLLLAYCRTSYFWPTAGQVTSGLLQDKLLLAYCRTSYFCPTAGQVTSVLLQVKLLLSYCWTSWFLESIGKCCRITSSLISLNLLKGKSAVIFLGFFSTKILVWSSRNCILIRNERNPLFNRTC